MTCASKIIESGHGRIVKAYLESLNHKILLFFILAGLTFLVALYAMAHGAYEISIKELLLALSGNGESAHGTVILDIRMPRVVSAIIAGWGLSLSGLCIQSVLRNPLGSPSTLGISQGAAFGAAFAIVLFGSQVFSATMFAFAGAFAAGLIILILATIKRLSGEAIILSGVAMASLFTSATVLIQYMASELELAAVVFWTFGDVARSNWTEIGLMTAATLLATVYLVMHRWDFNAFSAGEETARGLGVNVTGIRYAGIFTVSLAAALITAFLGVIAFVGLIAPHVARRIIGDDHRMLIPFSSIIGALLLLAADTVGRLVMGSGSLPVGVITSFLGAPMFLYLLIRGYQ
ncbi:MAG: iron ABC transporter permease [Deltaproteobacteria bacterium]|nr:iron ABC transporter permease [Deltaproteobacteria bacterium]